jgi:hypothetical protein
MVAAGVSVLFAAFVYSVHLGAEIRDPSFGRFRSRYDAPTLLRVSEDRLVTWKAAPPLERPRSRNREDQYQSEGHLHVQERNRRWEAGDFPAAWFENLILEKYYAPVLDTPSYLSKVGHRWPEAQRADAERRLGAASPANYDSRADAAEGRHFIRIWSPLMFWMIVGLGVCGVVAACLMFDSAKPA